VSVVARYSIAEALRRRVFTIIVALTAAFLVLYALGTVAIFDEVEDQRSFSEQDLLEERALTGGTLVGLGMFVIFFLGVVLSVFMTMSTVRGDAERGILQPIAVRPVGRRAILMGRLIAAGSVAAGYVAIVFLAVVGITELAGDWTPDRILTPALALMGAVLVVTCLSTLGSVHLPTSANGIAIFMTFGAGLTAGLLGQIGEALDSDRLEEIADVATFVLPFEGLYQGGLHELTADTTGIAEVVISLGPFGGADSLGLAGVVWAIAYCGAAIFLALRGFKHRDL
jgi:Cu-processing system permease protein